MKTIQRIMKTTQSVKRMKLMPFLRYALPFFALGLLMLLGFSFAISDLDGGLAFAQSEVDEPPLVVTVEIPVTVEVEVTRVVTVIVTPTHTPLPPTPTPLPPQDTFRTDNPFRGSADAPVKVIEFSDFQCGFCAHFYSETLTTLNEHYGDLIQFVYRHFPIFGDPSIFAAMGAECANQQGNFWTYHDLLFDSYLNDDGEYSPQTLAAHAQTAELDTETWATCFQDVATYNNVILDAIDAQEWGVTGTPTFFINGRILVGAQPLEVFIQVIDAELAALGIEAPTGNRGG